MNDLLHAMLLVLAPLAAASGVLYVLAVIDPQTQRSEPTATKIWAR